MQIQCQQECIIPDCSGSNWSTVNKIENFITEIIEEFFLKTYCRYIAESNAAFVKNGFILLKEIFSIYTPKARIFLSFEIRFQHDEFTTLK